MIIVVIGGSGSGKSEYAENLAVRINHHGLFYIATMCPFDDECKLRIKKHQAMRKEKNFDTIECYTGLDRVKLEKQPTVLLECMSNLIANEMFSEKGAGERTIEVVQNGVLNLVKQSENVIIVTNNIFADGIAYDSSTLEYMKILGKINCWMAEIAGEVIEVIHGIEVIRKGERQD